MTKSTYYSNSFYQNCEQYLKAIDPKNYSYLSLDQAIESYVKSNVNLNQYIKGNIFATNAECYEAPEQVSDVLKKITAAVYMILVNKKITLTGYDSLKDAISTDLNEVVGMEMSGEIMQFLESYEG